MIFLNKKGCADGFYFRNAAENIIVTILSLADRVSFSMLSPAEQVIKSVSTKYDPRQLSKKYFFNSCYETINQSILNSVAESSSSKEILGMNDNCTFYEHISTLCTKVNKKLLPKQAYQNI